MAESNFVDYVKILCRSGKGGAGAMHLYRAKYVPKGGPDGGDGGRGGNVYLRANRNLWTLLHLKYSRHVLAGNGSPGGANRSFGKDGEDKTIEVPCGTAVFDANTGEFLCEVTQDGEEVVLLKGGRGGLGNWHQIGDQSDPKICSARRTGRGAHCYFGVEIACRYRIGGISQCG